MKNMHNMEAGSIEYFGCLKKETRHIMYWDLVHDDLDPPYVLPTVERGRSRKRKVFNQIDLEAMVL